MRESIVVPVAVWLLTAVLGALAGSLRERLKAERMNRAQADERQRAMEDGTRVFLRSQLRMMHERYVVDCKPCSIEAKEEATTVYNAYHALGGNGTGTYLYNEIMEAHVKN